MCGFNQRRFSNGRSHEELLWICISVQADFNYVPRLRVVCVIYMCPNKRCFRFRPSYHRASPQKLTQLEQESLKSQLAVAVGKPLVISERQAYQV